MDNKEKCEYCGKMFYREEEEDEFERNIDLLSYRQLNKCLCSDCAIRAIEQYEEGIYTETCERCGKEFDLAEDEAEFGHIIRMNGISYLKTLREEWEGNAILCANCAANDVVDRINEYNDDEEEDSDDGEF